MPTNLPPAPEYNMTEWTLSLAYAAENSQQAGRLPLARNLFDLQAFLLLHLDALEVLGDPRGVMHEKHLNHFLQLALRGKAAGASGGEKNCYKIARLMLDAAPGLDMSAIAGAKQFCDLAASHRGMIRDFFEGK